MNKKLVFSTLSLFSLLLVGYAFSSSGVITDFSFWNNTSDKHDTSDAITAGTTQVQTTGTPCTTASIPFSESFNTSSNSKSCWTILDNNKDATSATSSNTWRSYSSSTYEGNGCMYFYGTSGTNKVNDDWLISPAFTVDANKTYRLRYYYRTNGTNATDYAVKLAQTGNTPADFTTTLVAKTDQQLPQYIEDTVYITGQNGTIYLAWHITTAKTTSYFYLDAVTLEEVNCTEPIHIEATNTQTNSISIAWEDNMGTAWEYYIQAKDLPAPTAGGTAVTTKTATLTQDQTGLPLSADTEYDIYLRSNCSNGTYTDWTSPFTVKTLCNTFNVPFSEGFDKTSTTLACWTILDTNKDAISTTGSNNWRPYATSPQAGDQSMYFYGSNSNTNQLPHNDWLISPTIQLDATKKYRVTYYYKTSSTSTYDYEFEVALSTQGTNPTDFSTVLVPKKKYIPSTEWKIGKVLVSGIGGAVNIGWHVTSNTTTTYLSIDTVEIEEVIGCFEPETVEQISVSNKDATLSWTDTNNQSWNYYVQQQGLGIPNQLLVSPTTQSTATITQESNGNPLTASTTYEFWIQSMCETNTLGDWYGPFLFTTDCATITTLPFQEGFNTNSPTFSCWTIIDNNQNATSPTGNNIWKQHTSTVYEGDRSMYIYENSGKADDWLISPTFDLTLGTYKITYYYKTNTSYDTSYALLLSKSGTAISDFTTVIKPAQKERVADYTKAIYYITNTTGKINLAWHLTFPSTTYLYLDDFTLEKVDCVSPDQEVIVSNITDTSTTFTWTDIINTTWEYGIVATGAPAPISTATTTQKTATINQLAGGAGALQPNTEYDFYVRGTCGPGKKSTWTGPITFRTACAIQPLPFWEGFNTDSTTLDCWGIVDNNQDATSPTGNNIWHLSTTKHEGTHSMQFYGSSGTDKQHDDWLISPSFTFVANKYYKLTYHYRTHTSYKTDFDVLLSTTGSSPANFTKVVLSKKQESNTAWQEESIVIGKTAGTVNFAWQVKTENAANYLYIDNVFIEEIACPSPTVLPVTNITKNSATINWKEDYMTNWEYYVIPAGSGTPVQAGTPSTTKSVAITTDSKGKPLTGNTAYDVYVRTACSDTDYSEWAGPLEFITDCDVFALPFWEGFNQGSKTFRCWEIVDANADATSPTGSNIWKTNSTNYEGGQSAYFYGSNADKDKLPHNDWLISPRMKGTNDATKIYRLKYHYRLNANPSYDYEFAVLLSNKTNALQDFTTVIKPKQKYNPSANWIEEYVFFTGVTADFQIAWQVTSATSAAYLYVDNVFIEEVQGCPEPILNSFEVKDIGETTATLLWDDQQGGTAWEYYVQPKGGKTPVTAGVATTTKEVVVTTETGGLPLNNNSDYEYYVRTVCGNGEYSIWTGPYYFTTLCGTFGAPYWEGFNKNSTISRCWTILDNTLQEVPLGKTWKAVSSNGNFYEGDQAWYYNVSQSSKKHNEWLISPRVVLDGGSYVVKYHYKTNTTVSNLNEFEVLVSTQGTDPKNFTTTLVPSKVYQIGNFVEEVVFLNGIKGDANIAWHVNAANSTSSHLYLDNVTIKKVTTCEEPYYVKMTSSTETTMEVEWQQAGGLTTWEVLVVNGQDAPTATPVQTQTVNGTPKATITGLQPGKVYGIYVRAKCATPDTYSDHSTRGHGYTRAGASNTCANAYTLPVNPNLECGQTVSGSIVGATPSGIPVAGCNKSLINDVWYTFTATKDKHRLTVSNVAYQALEGKPTLTPTLYGTIYNVDCTSITSNTVPVLCFSSNANGYKTILQNLVPGQRYYLRLGNKDRLDKDDNLLEEQMNLTFTLCLSTAEKDPLEVSPSGDKYTYEELIKDVFVKSNCDLVSNVKYQIGDGSPATQTINTLGYFNQGNSIFPFDEGIVLSTGEIEYVSGMFTDNNKGNNPHRWEGDKDLNDAINDAGGNPERDGRMRVTQLEFDFTPIKDSIQFEYLFASNSYISNCTYTCKNGALFAAWLIDSETGEGQNLAKIKGTDTPISLGNIWDNTKITGTSCNINPEYFWMNFTSHMDPMVAPINFAGMTVPMQSDMVYVEPGKKYHIKLAVMDFCGTLFHTSAVFFKAGSFDLGDLNLGKDLLVENDNALCSGETRTIHSGLSADPKLVKITWYKDDVIIPGAITPTLDVNESGTYKVTGYYNEIQCGVKGEIQVEIFPPIAKVVTQPNNQEICRYAQAGATLNLDEVTANMLAELDEKTQANYTRSYYTDAALTQPVPEANAFALDEQRESMTLYVLVQDLRTGCNESFTFTIKGVAGEAPVQPKDVVICSSFTLPKLEANQSYYTEPGAKGEQLKAGDILRAGSYVLYLYQDNGNFCYEETSFTVTVVDMPYLEHIDDQTLQCELYVLPELPPFNKYFIEVDGKRVPVAAQTPITQTNTKVYIVVESEDKTCKAETSFMVRYDDCPIPKGISPNGDGINDAFDLTQHGVSSLKIFNRNGTEVYSFSGLYTNQWMGQSKGNKLLPAGTYYYVIQSFDKTRTGWVQINK